METGEENKTQEAQVFSEAETSEIKEEAHAKKTKAESRSRLALVFILGFLIGIAVKAEALKKISIGYNDYLIESKLQSYDINKIQSELQKERELEEQIQLREEDGAIEKDESVDAMNQAEN